MEPIPHRLYTARRLFGLFRVHHYVENRRPDSPENPKFKHFISVRFLWWEYRWTYSTTDTYDALPYTGDGVSAEAKSRWGVHK